MDWGVAINVHEDFQQTYKIAKQVDDAGMDYVWIVDFPAPRFASSVAVKIASTTSNSRIGIGVLPSLLYSSDYIVRFTETLVDEFGERFDLLIGPGDRSALRAVGKGNWIPKEVVKTTVSTAVEIRNGLQEIGMKCPVWLAAQGPKMITESRKLDGVLLNLVDSAMVRWAYEILEDKPSSFQVGIFTPTKLTETPKPPSDDILYSAAIVAVGASKKLLQQFGIETEIKTALKELQIQGGMNDKVLERIGLDIILRWCIFETPEGLVQTISNLDNLGIDLTVFGPPLSHSKKSIRLLLEVWNRYNAKKT